MAPSDPVATAAARVASARQQADALASRYFAALDRDAGLVVQITDLETRIRDDETHASALRARVAVRARQLYETGGTTLVDFFDGADPLDSARRDHLVAAASARDNNVFNDLARQNEVLRSRRQQLTDDQRQQQQAIANLRGAQAAMDAQLASAKRALADAQAAVAAQAAAAPATQASASASGSSRSRGRSPSSPATTSPRVATPPIGPQPIGGGSGGSHHNDPFLVCTRARESSGDYSVVNPAGPWYGAYQFSQSTWDSVANHAGRLDLVGVRPNAASVSDQDDMAWTLYQWQGKGPWGGRC
ncbi:MAG: transglycosylase family protein [Actinobacteria bacterium]|nr:transglycosylase family protein [Actinomycetota bacterium]